MTRIIRYLTTFFCITILCFNGVAQGYPEYVPLEFANLETEWQHLCADSTIAGFDDFDFNSSITFTGTNHIPSTSVEWPQALIQDGYLYSVSDIRFDTEYGGALIEKIDLATGERVWKTAFDLRTTTYRELVVESFIEADTLVLACVEVYSPDFNVVTGLTWLPFYYADGALLIKKYNLETGNLVFRSTPDTLSQNLANLPVNAIRRVQTRYLGEQEYSSYWYIVRQNRYTIYVDTLDESGVKLNPTDSLDSIYDGYDCGYQGGYESMTFNVNKDGVFQIEYCNPPIEGDATSRGVFKYYDHRDNIPEWTIPLNVTDTTQFIFAQILNHFDDQIVLRGLNVEGEGDRVLCYNSQGEETCNFSFPRNRGLSAHKLSTTESEFLLTSKSSFDAEEDKKLYVFLVDDQQAIEYDSIEIVGDEPRIQLNGVYPIEEDFLLLDISFGPVNLNHRSWMKVRKENFLKMTTNTAEIESEDEEKFTCYPNPFSEVLHLRSKVNTKLELYDGRGKQVKAVLVTSSEQAVDLSELPAGIYWLRFTGQSEKFNSYKVIKI